MKALRITPEEAHALEVLDFLTRGRAIRIEPAAPIQEARPELAEVVARRLAATCLRILVDGGWREDVVLRGGRRFRGRIWDEALSDGLRLRFTAASHELWLQMTQRLAEVSRSAEVIEGEGTSRRARRIIRRIIKVAGTDTGDWLLFALTARSLARSRLPLEVQGELARRLAIGSPLATLVTLHDETPEGIDLDAHLDPLIATPAVRLLECCEELLVDGWCAAIRAGMDASPTAQRIVRLEAIARVIDAHLRALDRHRRLDLTRAWMRALVRLLAGPWAGAPMEVVQRLGVASHFESLGQRDALRRALARIVGVSERLGDLREAMALQAYGDPRYEESQLYLERFDALLARHMPRLVALTGALAGRLG